MSFRATGYGSATRGLSPIRTYQPSLRHSEDAAAAQTYTERARIEFTIISRTDIRVDSVYCLDREVIMDGRKEWEWASMPGLLSQVRRKTAISDYQGLNQYFNTDGRDIYGRQNLSNGSRHRVEGSIDVQTTRHPDPALVLQIVIARRAPPLLSPRSVTSWSTRSRSPRSRYPHAPRSADWRPGNNYRHNV